MEHKQVVNNSYSDIVIVGAGGAGLAAALTAAERGIKNIIVFEARSTPGGNSFFAEGFFAINNQTQNPADIQNLKDKLFQTTMSFTHHRAAPELVRVFINESANTLRWLQGKGFKLEWRNNISHNRETPLYANDTKAKTKTGAFIIKAMIKECQDRGIKILSKTRATKLLIDEKRNIAGILADSNGKVLSFVTKSVILASGGFAGNKRLLKKYVPLFTEDIHIGGVPNKGDGMLMAAEIGADTNDIIALEMEGPAFTWSRKLPITFTGHPATVWINRNGVRFAEETFEPFLCANNLNRQPGKVSYTLLDEDLKNSIIKEASIENEELGIGKESTRRGLEKLLKAQTMRGRIKIADSWDEIAEWIGILPDILKSTIKEYNSFCKKGHDDLFSKDPRYLIPLHRPPYYAICCHPNLLVTHGGIRINLKMEVLDKNANPIPGLYAAGVDTGGIDADTYNFSLPGHSFGFALNSGRIAGKEAAEYVSK